MSIASNKLLKAIQTTQQPENTVRLAKVNRTVGSSTYVQFYGETEPSQMPFKKTSDVGAVSVGTTVIMTKINNSYIITGRIV